MIATHCVVSGQRQIQYVLRCFSKSDDVKNGRLTNGLNNFHSSYTKLYDIKDMFDNMVTALKPDFDGLGEKINLQNNKRSLLKNYSFLVRMLYCHL